MTVSDGSTRREVDAGAHRIPVRERPEDDPATAGESTLVFVESGSSVPDELVTHLPSDLRVIVAETDRAADLSALITHAGLDAVHLVGWDASAAAALEYAQTHPVRSLTIRPHDLGARPDAEGATSLSGGAPPLLWISEPEDVTTIRHTLLQVIGYIGPSNDPAPPTEAIILKSED